ncbi:MAG: hypothetical protein K2M41_05715 [Muribaculaceae bacterium]|nr:hypothetical protein [Muribaculaceae bacterium]
MNWTSEHWQYLAVTAIILYAIWRMLRGLRKVKNNPGTCSGCSLASQCHDFKKNSDIKSETGDIKSKNNCCCHSDVKDPTGNNHCSCHN